MLKDFIFARALEKWKARQQLRQIYLKVRDPLLLATTELVSGIGEITLNLEPRLLQIQPARMTATVVPAVTMSHGASKYRCCRVCFFRLA